MILPTSVLRRSSFNLPNGLITGDAPHIGVLDLPATHHHPPLRLFFPATLTADNGEKSRSSKWSLFGSSKKPQQATYFVDNRVSYFMEGMAHTLFARHTTKMFRFFIRPLMWMMSLLFPMRYLRIPDTIKVPLKRGDGRDIDAVDFTEDDLPVKYLDPNSLFGEFQDENEQQPASKIAAEKNQSLVIFSHGLTGTGEENSVFCTSLAKKGYVVACLHHCDGSSSRVPLPDGTCRYYEHLPVGDDWDPRLRLEQVHVRARELLDTCSWLLGEDDTSKDSSTSSGNGINGTRNGAEDGRKSNQNNVDQHPALDRIRPRLNPEKIICAGFSYGAATCALAATLEPKRFQCGIFLDGWFHIDYSSKGVEFDFPPEAFGNDWPEAAMKSSSSANGSKHDGKNVQSGLSIPAIFINSSQFEGYKKLYAATCRLADKVKEKVNSKKQQSNGENQPTSEMHVIPNTGHQNFCDVVFWLPQWMLRRAGKFLVLGSADGLEAYENIVNWTLEFLKQF